MDIKSLIPDLNRIVLMYAADSQFVCDNSAIIDYGLVKSNGDALDWRHISRCPTLAHPFIRRFANKLNWRLVSKFHAISTEFLAEFKTRLRWAVISYRRHALSEGIMSDFRNNLDWHVLAYRQKISGPYIWSMNYYLSCRYDFALCTILQKIFKFQWMPESFIEKYIDEGEMVGAAICQPYLSDVLVKKCIKILVFWGGYGYITVPYKDRANINISIDNKVNRSEWRHVCMSTKISEDLICEHSHLMDWAVVSKYQTLSLLFIRYFKDKLDWQIMSRYQKLDECMINDYIDEVDWNAISKYQKLSISFIRQHAAKLNWGHITKKIPLTEANIEEFANYINWRHVSNRAVMSDEFIRKFAYKIDWYIMTSRQLCNDPFIQEFAEQVYWPLIMRNIDESPSASLSP